MEQDRGLDATVQGLLILCHDADLRELWACFLKLFIGFDSLWSKYFSVTGVIDANGLPMRSRMGGFGASVMKALYLILMERFAPALSILQATGAVFHMLDTARDVELGREGSRTVGILCTDIKVKRTDLEVGASVMTAAEEGEYADLQGRVSNKQLGAFYTSRSQVDRERLTPTEVQALKSWTGLKAGIQFAAVNGQLAPCLASLGVLVKALSERSAGMENAELVSKLLRRASKINYPTKASLSELKKAFLGRLSHDLMRLQDAVAGFAALMWVDKKDRYGSMLVPNRRDMEKVKPIPPAKATKLADDADLPVSVVEDIIASACCFEQCYPNLMGEFAEFVGRAFSVRTVEVIIAEGILAKAALHRMTSDIETKKGSVRDIGDRLKEIIRAVDVDAFPVEFGSESGVGWMDRMYELYARKLQEAGPNGPEALKGALEYIKRASTVINGRFTYPLFDSVDKKRTEDGQLRIVGCYHPPSTYLRAVSRAIDWKQVLPGQFFALEVMRQFMMDLVPTVPYRVSTNQGEIQFQMAIASFVTTRTDVWKKELKPLFEVPDIETEKEDDEE